MTSCRMQHLLAQQIKLGAAIHLALEQLEAIHLPFDLARTPRLAQCGTNADIFLGEALGKRLEFWDATRGTGLQPAIKGLGLPLAHHRLKFVREPSRTDNVGMLHEPRQCRRVRSG